MADADSPTDEGNPEAGTAPESFVFPTSITQRRFWVLDQLEPGNPAYNIAVRFRLKGPLDVALLERAFNAIIARHEVLRTTFTTHQGQPVQVIAPVLAITVAVT